LRLGPDSKLRLKEATLSPKKKKVKKFSARLMVGRMWASVTKLFGKESRFEVETPNAVAGVRGTVFAVDHAESGMMGQLYVAPAGEAGAAPVE